MQLLDYNGSSLGFPNELYLFSVRERLRAGQAVDLSSMFLISPCSFAAKFAYEVLYILYIQLRLFPGHEVTTTRKFGKMHQVDLACSPLTWQGRIIRTMGHSSRNRFTLAQVAAAGNLHVFVIRTNG